MAIGEFGDPWLWRTVPLENNLLFDIYVTPYLWNCPFHEMGKYIAHFAKWAVYLPISWNGQNACLFGELGSRKSAHFTNWANVVNEIYIFVHKCREPRKRSRCVTRQFSVVISSSSFSPGPRLLLRTNRKSHTRFRLVPNSSNLDNLERPKRPSRRNRQKVRSPPEKFQRR